MNNNNKDTARGKLHRRSFFGPILLITIGLVFLAKNLGLIPGEGWETIWRLWPLLLIIGGLDDLFRREGVAWPVLMIGVGAGLLYNYFGPQSWISWTQIIQLWPVILIAIGIDFIFKGQSGWRILLGVLLSVVLIGAAFLFAFQGVTIQADYVKMDEQVTTTMDSAEMDLSLSVGEFVLSESRNGKLVYGVITPGSVVDDLEEVRGHARYELASTRPSFFPYTARWELGLTSAIPLDVALENSVGEMLLDLAALDLESLVVNQGVGRMYVDLPESILEEVLIKQGVGIIVVEFPEDIRIAVDAQNGLTRVKFPSDFELEDGFYTNPGSSRTNADLLIVVEQGIGLVTFQYAK